MLINNFRFYKIILSTCTLVVVEYCIRSFSWNTERPWFYLTDFDAHCVSTYSYRGEFVHTFGKEGRQKGEFIHPKGLTISPSGQIIVISENPDHCVQVFSS